MESAKPNPPLFWGVLIVVVAVDVVTKLMAVANSSSAVNSCAVMRWQRLKT